PAMPQPRRLPPELTALVVILLLPQPAAAVNRSWNNAAGGAASTAGNWTPSGVPTAADLLIFNLTGTYGVTFDASVAASQSHSYGAGTVTLTMAAPHVMGAGILISSGAGSNPSVNLRGSLTAKNNSALASAVGSSGSLRVTGSSAEFLQAQAGTDLRVGQFGTGVLQVDGGSLVQIDDDLLIGDQSGSTGTATITGRSAALIPSRLRTQAAAGDMLVGLNGTGTLNVTEGADVLAQGALLIGSASGGVGVVEVRGSATVTSQLKATTGLSVGANSSVAAAGQGRITVYPLGLVVSSAAMQLGDPNGGVQGFLAMQGGTVHTRDLFVDATQGLIDFEGGTIRVDGGTFNFGRAVPFAVQGTTSGTAGRLELIRGAVGTTADALRLEGFNAQSGTLFLDSGASLLVTGDVEARTGSNAIVADSSATLVVDGRLHLGGSSNAANLHAGVGALVEVFSMEMTDGPGASANASINGAGARLRVADHLLVGGDEATVGGPAALSFVNQGALEAGLPTSRLTVRPPGFVAVGTGSSIAVGGRLTIEGRLRLEGGTMSGGEVQLAGAGRLEARGVVPCAVRGTAAGETIEAIGPLDLGSAALSDGFSFPGTLWVGPHLVRLFDSNTITLGDSTILDGGELVCPNPSLAVGRVVTGHGTIRTGFFTSNGSVEAGDEAFGTLAFTGIYSQLAAGTLALSIGGSSAGQFDRITVTGQAGVNGTLRLQFPPGAALTQGVAIPLVTGGSRTGTFSSVVVEGYPSAAALVVTYTPTQVLLTLQSAVDVPAPPVLPAVLALRGVSGSGAPAFHLDLPEAADVRVELFAASGRRVVILADRGFPAGSTASSCPRRLPGSRTASTSAARS
ncbi:MAG: hypothetical protein ABIP29_11435, partial [Candidatus Eisenbacteria bacterium]